MPRFNITPVPKPRMTHADRRIPRPPVMRYWAFKDELTRLAKEADFELGESFMVIFYMPMPQSWSATKKRQMLGQPHKQTPDTDNMVKAIADTLLPAGDAGIWCTIAAKFWAIEGAIEIKNLDKSEVDYILVRKDIK